MSNAFLNWPEPPSQPELSRASIHVWRLRLDVGESRLEKYVELLSADERQRAEAFHFVEHRQRYIASRGQLRMILTAYIGTDPRRHQFRYGVHGKPSLTSLSLNQNIHFNVSKSHNLALVAVTEGREVGVDIEHLRPVTDAEQIAQRFFSSRESCQLASFHVDRRNMAFLHIWTQKEAILKATGKGLSFPLDGLTVNADPDLSARVIELGGDEGAAAAWQVTSLRPAPEYLAALASLGDARSICCWGADAGI